METRTTKTSVDTDDKFQSNERDVLTPRETGVLLQMNVKTVLELFHAGVLPGREITPRLIRFSRSALLEWLNN